MWTSFHGYATEQTQLREGKGISELEDMQNETQIGQKELTEQNTQGQKDNIKQFNIKVEEKREIKGRKIFEEIKAKNFPK